MGFGRDFLVEVSSGLFSKALGSKRCRRGLDIDAAVHYLSPVLLVGLLRPSHPTIDATGRDRDHQRHVHGRLLHARRVHPDTTATRPLTDRF